MRAMMIGGLIVSSVAVAEPDEKPDDKSEQETRNDRELLSIVDGSEMNAAPETPQTVKNSKQRLMEAYDAGDEKFKPEDPET